MLLLSEQGCLCRIATFLLKSNDGQSSRSFSYSMALNAPASNHSIWEGAKEIKPPDSASYFCAC
jgi:hypothetical protein